MTTTDHHTADPEGEAAAFAVIEAARAAQLAAEAADPREHLKIANHALLAQSWDADRAGDVLTYRRFQELAQIADHAARVVGGTSGHYRAEKAGRITDGALALECDEIAELAGGNAADVVHDLAEALKRVVDDVRITMWALTGPEPAITSSEADALATATGKLLGAVNIIVADGVR